MKQKKKIAKVKVWNGLMSVEKYNGVTLARSDGSTTYLLMFEMLLVDEKRRNFFLSLCCFFDLSKFVRIVVGSFVIYCINRSVQVVRVKHNLTDVHDR